MRRLTAVVLALTVVALGCSGEDNSGSAGGAPSSSRRDSSTSTSSTTVAPPASRSTLVIAHRGASAYAPEHTFASYDLALDQGADYIEQDLQMTADGQLVVLHDPILDRTARGPADACTGPVASKTLVQLSACDVGSWFNDAHPDRADPAFAQLRIPTLREVLERYAGRARFYIETKSPEAQPGMEQALLDVLNEVGPPVDDTSADSERPVIIQSFSAESLQLVHSLRPELPLVLLLVTSGEPLDPAILDGVGDYAVGVGPSSGNVDEALVDAARSRCLDVHPYTVDDPAEMTRLIAAGVDGMFTNAPDVLRPLVASLPAGRDACG